MKRNLLSLAEYKTNVGDIHSQITEIINASFEDWNQIQNFSNSLQIGTVIYKPRTKAGIVHDHICHRVLSSFYNHPDVKVGEFNGVFGFLYKDLFFIRFKKMNSRTYNLSNINTAQNLRYLYQDSTIPGLPVKPTILYAGYTLDRTSSRIQGIYTACWDGTNIMWIDEHGIEAAEQLPLAFESHPEQPYQEIEKVIKRVTVKSEFTKVSKQTGTN